MGSRTAISAGALAVALAAVPVLALPAPALARDCPRGGGLLSPVTDGLCDVVGTVTGTVDKLTGKVGKPVTKGLNDTTDSVLGRVGEAVPTAKPTASSSSETRPTPGTTELLPETLGEVCLPVLACEERGTVDTHSPAQPTDTAEKPVATPSAKARKKNRDTAVQPTHAPTHPQTETYQMDSTREPVKDDDEPTVDTDDAHLDLLWPNPLARELTVPLRDQHVVRPSPPASDVVGTALTILLLASAILATRIVQQRRQNAGRPDSIPFEPGRAGNGRHRLA
ncbi:hypothetical protein ABT294_33915 [Nonomuraea sp. NPDC000554]|uniref:hypothetical protein n=1 Tax=Nonomuraea sp. NPDC000554 TaxID=3154259 RepID=UPI003319A4E3